MTWTLLIILLMMDGNVWMVDKQVDGLPSEARCNHVGFVEMFKAAERPGVLDGFMVCAPMVHAPDKKEGLST